MIDRRKATATSAPAHGVPAGSAAQTESSRSLLLEFRLEQLRSVLDEARANADQARARLAEAAVREADQTRRYALLQDDLARALEEVSALHRRLEHSDALRADLTGHLFESDTRDDAQELVRLRQEVEATRERALFNEQAAAQLRARVDELVANRETLLTRVAEWQQLVRNGDPEAIDLAEFIAHLRRAIIELERENALGERREAALREQIDQRGSTRSSAAVGMPAETDEASATAPASSRQGDLPDMAKHDAASRVGQERRPEDLVAALPELKDPKDQADLLLRLGRTGGDGAFCAIRPWAAAPDPIVRAAAYQALGRLLERDPARLEPQIRGGIADPHPHVRRRAVLAAAGARGLALRPLLEPLAGDPDPQVRRVVHQVLRRTPPDSALVPVDGQRRAARVRRSS